VQPHRPGRNPPVASCFIFNASTVGPNDSVTVTLRGVTNPASGSTTDTVSASTTSDTTPVTSSQYTIGGAPPPPTVVGVSPSSGPAGGGTTVTITGAIFTGATAVNFGARSASSFTVDSDTQITATSPGGSGSVDVTVTTPGGTNASSAADRFSYSSPPLPFVSSAPAVAPMPPAAGGSTAAALSGSVVPNGQPTTVHWEYGLDTRYRVPGFSGSIFDQSTASQAVGSDFASHGVSVTVSSLVPNALYHSRLVASNANGTTVGKDQTFMTPKGPAPPAPVLGSAENVGPVGSVFVIVNGKRVPLTQTRQLPSGTVLDTVHGSVNVVAATGKKGKNYTATFGGAVLKLNQTRSGPEKGLTTVSVLEGAFPGAPSYARCAAGGAADGRTAHAALSGRILQTLRSRVSGRFRSRGRYAAATVRGTQWTTTDRCDGTLVAVQLHTVLVNDLVKHITVAVRAGHSYLAKAPTKKRK
jgi:hypothetical protein